MDRHTGVTLIEWLAALAILGLLTGIAVPSLDRILLNARRASAMEALWRSVWFARTEAVQRGRPVVLCASASGMHCDAGVVDWSAGWRVASLDDLGETLRQAGPVADRRARLLANRAEFRFEPQDRRSTNGTLVWCDQRGAPAARALVIAATGRPRLENGPGSLACVAP